MTPVLVSVAFAAAATITVAAHALGRQPVVYVFKPLSTALLLLLVAAGSSVLSSRYAAAVFGGLFFSLLGDVFLMLPSDRFRSGLFCFLLAHASYVFAFLQDSPLATPLLPFAVWIAVGSAVFRVLWPGIPRRLRLPVAAYVAILLVMAGQASSRAGNLHTAPALQTAFGAALFVLSDSLLAWNRFRKPFPGAQALVHASYFTAQWLIAIAACRT
ncbi:MAG TPA: lysoplasmalogenase [Thermoanaerobaculia bacterium]|nr:lysoplasmalogenase [Thermoanaerobaculia bacterium]